MTLSNVQFPLAALFTSFVVLNVPVLANAQSPRPIISAPTIYSVDPTYGTAETSITIIGRGFSIRNTVLFGTKSILDAPIAWQAGINCVEKESVCHPGINQAIVITVPRDAAVGPYDVSIENSNGVSNGVMFMVVH